jgi:hypothetical protein
MADSDDWNAAGEPIGPDGELDPDATEGIEAVLGFELPPPVEPRRRSRVNIATAVLAALVFAAGTFYAGVRVEKSKAKTSTTGSLAAAFSRFAGARGAGAAGGTGARGTGTGAGAGAGGAAGAGAGVTVGTVKLVDGNNVYVTDTSGGITKVAVGSSATVTVSSSGKVSDVKPGDTVIVRGAAGSDGTVNATSLSDSGAGGAAAGGFGGFGGGGFGGGGGAGGATTPTTGG